MSVCSKNKPSEGHRDQRRANWKIGVTNLVKCPKCGEFMMPYRACKDRGMYNKKEIVKVID